MKTIYSCPTCQSYREICDHLFELSEFCRLLSNTSIYRNEERQVTTESIGAWLRLASELESVSINKWKFEDPNVLCESIATANDELSENLGDFSTNLTRFMYMSYALDETYRYVDRHYTSKNPTGVARQASLRACWVIDDEYLRIPEDMDHAISNLKTFMTTYDPDYENKIFNKHVQSNITDSSYGLHLVRGLRNIIAHGVFPIVGADGHFAAELSNDSYTCQNLLRWGTRVGVMYIQLLMANQFDGFSSPAYNYLVEVDSEHEDNNRYFYEHCTKNLALHLHKKIEFTFLDPLGEKSRHNYLL
ncbi:hypothetical protein [Vibrio crassostreae]|uniref:hypothetical protein n=1 Tax=Vibrio crassostreae TaxID=246167 RepID=UPI000F4F7630|nr:hypothetical protein [Vibrio crassostreae]